MKRPAKYGNTKITVDNIVFDSKAEARRYGELKLLQRAGEISGLHMHPAFNLFGQCNTKICKYVGDFQYRNNVGVVVVEDVKGVKTTAYRLKAKLFRDNFGFAITEVQT